MKDINRREFLGGLSVGASGTLLSTMMPHRETVKNTQILKLSKLEENISPRDVKINVKPVGNYFPHDEQIEGPCRPRPSPPAEEESANYKNSFKKWIERLKSSLSIDVKLLDPLYQEFKEDYRFGFGENELRRLEADSKEVDLYICTGNNYPQYAAIEVGIRYKKPVAMTGNLVNRALSASLRSRGLEGYAPENYDELNKLISILRARKVFQQTNLLFVSDYPFTNRPAPTSSCANFKDLKDRLGIKTIIISYKEFGDERDRIMKSRNIMAEVENLADKLIRNAQAVHIERKWVISSAIFHTAVRNLMKKFNCNAFTIECFEFCSSGLSDEWKVVPCLTHSINKSEGYPSGCEGDLNVTFAIDLLQGVSKKAAFMGNLSRRDEDVVRLGHNVPAMKMNGFDKPDIPYELRNFIYSGWGTKVNMDMTLPEEKTVTIARCNPSTTKICVIKGELFETEGFDRPGCALGARIRVPDARKAIKKAENYGFHAAMVYGDYAQEIIELGDMLNIEVETHNV